MMITNCRILILQVLYVGVLISMHIEVTLFKTYPTQCVFPYGRKSIFGVKPWYLHKVWPNAEAYSSIPVGSCCCDCQVCVPPHTHWDVRENMQRDER
jgi:hypothetical protein